MKASFVSSSAISQALRYSMLRTQNDLVQAQKEAATGKLADSGLVLGARTAQAVSFARDFERLNGIVDSNALVSSRLSSTQTALGQLSGAAQDFLSTLTAAASGDAADGALPINADAKVLGATLKAEESLSYDLGPGRRAYLVPAVGEVEVNGETLHARDAAAIVDEATVTITAKADAELVMVDSL